MRRYKTMRSLLREDAGVQMKYTVVSLRGHINEDSYEEGEGKEVASFNGKDVYCMGLSSNSIKDLLDEVAEKCSAEGGFEWEFNMNYDYEKTGVVEFWNDTAMREIGGDFISVNFDTEKDFVKQWEAGKAKMYNQHITVAVKCVAVAPKIPEEELDAVFKSEGIMGA